MNVSAILKREKEEKARVKPLPKLFGGKKSMVDSPQTIERKQTAHEQPTTNNEQPISERQILLDKLDAELAQMKRYRGKLATRTA